MTLSTFRPASAALFLIAVAAICALALALPGQTVTTKYLNDLFIFLDGAHRVTEGQVPNRDFHTALGPLVYYAPAIGYWLSGNLGSAMPTGMALLVLTLAPVAAHILGTRLRPTIAMPLGVFLFLIAAVPINLDESIGSLSFAMFYNRIGWSALGFLLIMYLRPEHPRRYQTLLDAASAALLVILMLYTKISYGVVGIGFLLLTLLDPRKCVWATAALALVLGAGLIIEAFWGGTATYIDDLLLAASVSGNVDTVNNLATVVSRNLVDYILFSFFAGFAIWFTRSIRDLLFFGFCAISGFLLISQNFQNWGIITLSSGAAVATENIVRSSWPATSRRHRFLTVSAQILLFALLLPVTIHNAAALGLHAGLATMKQGQAVPLPRFGEIRLVELGKENDYKLFSRYFSSLADGAQALASLNGRTGNVLVLDFVNPFSAGLGIKSPYGDSTWHHWGRTLNEEHYVSPGTLFSDVRIVMEPKWPMEVATAEGLRRIYADFLAEHFVLSGETADWRIHVLRDPPSETVSRSPGSPPDEREDHAPPDGG